MDKPARLFLCARCRVQVLICSDCDRGNRYCADGCANVARRALQRDAGERYQDSYWGRTKHAWRTRRWRQRRAEQRQSVTHQGSHLAPTDAVLAGPPPIVPATAVTATLQPCISTPCIDAASTPTDLQTVSIEILDAALSKTLGTITVEGCELQAWEEAPLKAASTTPRTAVLTFAVQGLDLRAAA